MSVVIREYTAADRPVVEAHLVEFQDHERKREADYAPGAEIAGPYLSGLLGKMADGRGKILLVRVAGVEAGYACFHVEAAPLRTFPDHLVVDDIYLAPGFRGMGIGRRFLEMAESFGRERGCPR